MVSTSLAARVGARLDAQFVPAPFWRRLVARTIDLFACRALTFVAIVPIVIPALIRGAIIGQDLPTSLGAFLAFLLAFVAIEYFLLRRRGGLRRRALSRDQPVTETTSSNTLPLSFFLAFTYAFAYLVVTSALDRIDSSLRTPPERHRFAGIPT